MPPVTAPTDHRRAVRRRQHEHARLDRRRRAPGRASCSSRRSSASARTSAPSPSASPQPATSSARPTCSGDSRRDGSRITTRPASRASIEAVGKLDMASAVADCVAAVATLGRARRGRRDAGRDRILPRRHVGVRRGRERRPERVRQLLRLGRPVDDRPDRPRDVPDVVPLRQHRRLHPQRRRRRRRRQALAGRPGFVLNVEAAGHAFDNHESAMFYNESAAKAAWSKTMAFLGEHLPREPASEHEPSRTVRSVDTDPGQSNRPGWRPASTLGRGEADVRVGGGQRDPATRACGRTCPAG